jgi:hypothetical protein
LTPLDYRAYLAILTDRFPTEKPRKSCGLKAARTPTVARLLRLIYSIPSAFVLGILSIVGDLSDHCRIGARAGELPDGIYNFQRGLMRWEARLLGYRTSLVDRYRRSRSTWAEAPGPAAWRRRAVINSQP